MRVYYTAPVVVHTYGVPAVYSCSEIAYSRGRAIVDRAIINL